MEFDNIPEPQEREAEDKVELDREAEEIKLIFKMNQFSCFNHAFILIVNKLYNSLLIVNLS